VTKKIWLSLVIVLTFVFLTGLTAYACGNHDNNGTKGNCPMAVEGAKVEVTNIANGITVQITSDDPEVVKQIQECAANCKCEGKKNVKCEMTNVANGVTMTITSDDPKVVKKIQERRANCLKNCHKGCSKQCLGRT